MTNHSISNMRTSIRPRGGFHASLYSYLLFHVPLMSRRAETWAAERLARWAGGEPPHTFTSPAELAQLLRLALLVPRGGATLEIGSYLGASARYLAAGAARRAGRLYCVDTWANQTMPDGERDTFAEFQRNVAGLAAYIISIRKTSGQINSSDIHESIHLVFIDGDHSYDAVRRDVDVVLPFLSHSAIIAFHDSNTFEGVGRCIGELLASKEWMIRGNLDSLTWLARSSWSMPSTCEENLSASFVGIDSQPSASASMDETLLSRFEKSMNMVASMFKRLQTQRHEE